MVKEHENLDRSKEERIQAPWRRRGLDSPLRLPKKGRANMTPWLPLVTKELQAIRIPKCFIQLKQNKGKIITRLEDKVRKIIVNSNFQVLN